jgi:glycosyltransferase involved in cell wall biosynthesis
MNHGSKTGQSEHRVSCIIPAYNEAKRIGAVISAVMDHPLIAEVIVVDDGSTDETASVALGFKGVLVLRLSCNSGKTHAIEAGLNQASCRYIMLVDADLEGLNVDDLTRLIHPVLSGSADVSMSLRRNAPWLWHRIGIDYITGERVIPVELIANRTADLRGLPRFGFEIWLNRICVATNSRLAVVRWDNVESPLKIRKHGYLHGIRADAEMVFDLLRSASALQLVRQIISMRRLRVDYAGTGELRRSGQQAGNVADVTAVPAAASDTEDSGTLRHQVS